MKRPQGNRSKQAKVTRRAASRLRHNQFARATGLTDSKGIANASQDTLDGIPNLFKEPCVVDEATLRRLYGPRVTPTRESTAVTITLDDVYKRLEEIAPLTTPHRDGWRAEHLLALCKDADCEATFCVVIAALTDEDVTDVTCHLLSFSAFCCNPQENGRGNGSPQTHAETTLSAAATASRDGQHNPQGCSELYPSQSPAGGGRLGRGTSVCYQCERGV